MKYDRELSQAQKKAIKVLNNKELSEETLGVLKKLKAYVEANGLAENTLSIKLENLEKFSLFIKKDYKEVTKEDITNYLSWVNNNHSGGTPTLIAINLKCFFKWFYENYMEWKPRFQQDYPELVSWIKTSSNNNNGHLLPEEILTLDEIKSLVEHSTSLRNKALIMLLYDGALRIGEALNLKIKNLVFDEYGGYIIIPKSKTGMRKVRLVDSIPFLKEYINQEHPTKDNPETFLFVGVESKGSKIFSLGKQLDSGGARIMISRTAERAGIKKNIYPHLFRHTKLTHMASDFSEQEMKIFAGWSGGSNMPQIYVHLSDSDVGKKILEKKGILKEENRDIKDQLKPKRCIDPSCGHLNPATTKFCAKCHRPLDIKTIMEIEEKIKVSDEVLTRAIDRDPSFRAVMKETIKDMIKSGEIKF